MPRRQAQQFEVRTVVGSGELRLGDGRVLRPGDAMDDAARREWGRSPRVAAVWGQALARADELSAQREAEAGSAAGSESAERRTA